MIFLGSGALLWRAVEYTLAQEHPVDLVLVPPGETTPASVPAVAVTLAGDANASADLVATAGSDDVVFSINNPTILREPLLRGGRRIYNIHNGPLPRYRGLPEAAIAYALLADERSYGATLHRVDAGIDTGDIVDTETFPIASTDRFQEVMLNGLRACAALFERNLDAIAHDTAPATPQSDDACGYYGRAALRALAERVHDVGFDRATALGVFTSRYPEIAALRAHCEAR